MKKKGFTLVELLAVIAILAILVIIALPNVLNMYRDARKKSFENEAKELYRSAQQQYLFKSSDMGAGTSDNYFIFASDDNGKNDNIAKLDIQGGTNVKYCIRINNLGVVTKFYADNGTYSVTGPSGYTDVSLVNVDEDRASDGANYGRDKCKETTDKADKTD